MSRAMIFRKTTEILLFCLFFFFFTPHVFLEAKIRNVILVSWDGVERSSLEDLLNGGHLPHLQGLIDRGTFLSVNIKHRPTLTLPGHAEMLTGYFAEVNGVYDHEKVRTVKKGITVYERLKKHFGNEGIYTVCLANKPGAWVEAGNEERGFRRGILYNARDSIDLHREMGMRFDPKQKYVVDGSIVLKEAIPVLERTNTGNNFIFLHFSFPDFLGHVWKSGSVMYDWAIVMCDYYLGSILTELEEAGSADETVIFVTTDHGFTPGGYHHEDSPHAWLVTNDGKIGNRDSADVQLADIAVTIYDIFGLEYRKFKPILHGRSLRQALFGR